MINQTYGIYILISIALTIWVARTLYRNGRVFLVEVFGGDEEFADSVNHLLVVGFYLVNLGFVCLNMTILDSVPSLQLSIEHLGTKLGIVLLVLGGMHFFNLFIFSRIRANQFVRRQKEKWLDMNQGVTGPVPPRGYQS